VIKIEHLKKKFGSNQVLRDINLTINKGEVVVIVGSSGSGKSTLLRCINHLEPATAGHIWIDGVDVMNPKTNINKVRAEVGMVFQQFNLFTNLTALDNIKLALLKVRKINDRDATRFAKEKLKAVGLSEKANTYPKQLSGGQQQRVAIARALAMNPKIMLFDEPTSALDPETVDEVLDIIRKLAQTGMTMVIITHEMGFARNVASRMIFLDEGYIVADDKPSEIMDHSTNHRIKAFFEGV
jgi:polar amino acid transport system ATP-binding protein